MGYVILGWEIKVSHSYTTPVGADCDSAQNGAHRPSLSSFLVHLELWRVDSCVPSLTRDVMLGTLSSIGVSSFSLRLALSVRRGTILEVPVLESCVCVSLFHRELCLFCGKVCSRRPLPFQPVFEVWCAV